MVILTSIVFICAGLLSSYVYASKMLSLRAAELAQIVETGNQERAQVLYLKQQKDALRETLPERDRLNSYFMDERSVAEFLSSVEQIGRDIGVKVETTSLGVNSGVLQVSVTIDGGFSGITHFVSLFEKMPYKLRIDRATLNAGGEGWVSQLAVSVLSFKALSKP